MRTHYITHTHYDITGTTFLSRKIEPMEYSIVLAYFAANNTSHTLYATVHAHNA